MFNVFVLENIIFLSTLILPEIAAALAPRLSLHDLTVASILTAEKHNGRLRTSNLSAQFQQSCPKIRVYIDNDERGTTQDIHSYIHNKKLLCDPCEGIQIPKFKFKLYEYDIRT